MPIYKIKKSKDGKQGYKVQISYTDDLGNYRQLSRTVYGANEAKDAESALLKNAQAAQTYSDITVKSLYIAYCAARRYEIRESTLAKFKSIVSNHILPVLGNKKLSRLTLPVLQDWKTTLEKKTIPATEKPLGIKIKQNAYSALRCLLNWAVKMGYTTTNNLVKLGNFKSVTDLPREMLYYTAEEYKRFAAAALNMAQNGKIKDWDYYVFFSIAFYTGMRKGEIHALKWSDINGDFLTVSRSITQKLHGDDRETPPKNRSSVRTIQLPLPLKQILDEHKRRWQEYKTFSDNFRVCGGTAPLRDSSIEKRNTAIAAAAGVKKIRIHDFRHSHASLLANSGINIQEIARRLGHSDIEMTWNTYSHLYPREEERAISVLNSVTN